MTAAETPAAGGNVPPPVRGPDDMPDLPKGGIWFMPSPSGGGTVVYNAHPAGACAGRGCALHGPSDHWMRDMPLRWVHPGDEADGEKRSGYMERLCPHGLWHWDPDDRAFQEKAGWKTRPAREGFGCECECKGLCSCEWMPPF